MMLVAGGMLLTACNSKQEGSQSETTATTENTANTADVNIPLASLASNKDHVCGMELSEGGVTDTLQLGEKVYGFCAAECKAEFAKNPDQYLANK